MKKSHTQRPQSAQRFIDQSRCTACATVSAAKTLLETTEELFRPEFLSL
jgi:hypothetical protein